MSKYAISLCDTDSCFFYRKDGLPISKEEHQSIIDELNATLPDFINFGNNGYFPKMIVVKSKNYVMKTEDDKVKYKGSALTDTKRETKFLKFIKEVVNLLLADKQSEIVPLYNKYAKEIMNITDISAYVTKKTITSSVLNPQRTNESKIFDALAHEENIQEGSKYWFYYNINNELKLDKYWNNDHDPYRLLSKLHKTALIFSNILDKSQFINYSLKGKRALLETL